MTKLGYLFRRLSARLHGIRDPLCAAKWCGRPCDHASTWCRRHTAMIVDPKNDRDDIVRIARNLGETGRP